jgi:uncharacterized protein involved in tolerance to divalent cations
MMIESLDDKFAAIEATIRQLHSYETFVLEALPVYRASKGVEKWVQEVLI